MRKPIDEQLKFGEVDISQITFDSRSRDEIPQLLMGLKHIYCTLELRDAVFDILNAAFNCSTEVGRPGMDLWRILVLGTVRLNCNWDYDKLKEMADNHLKIREMLGHGFFDREQYGLQTLKDNIPLLTEDLLKQINVLVVEAGHNLVKKKAEQLQGRVDSFVVETDVHFPTDINLLLDAMRKVITLLSRLSLLIGLPGWRQGEHNLKKVKKLFNTANKMKGSTAKDEQKRAAREEQIRQAHCEYLEVCEQLIERAATSLSAAMERNTSEVFLQSSIGNYIEHARRQIEQIRRRVLDGGTIAHAEKVFSIFQEHTEWIKKGKAGVPQELGLRVSIVEDQYGFILNHMVHEKQTDDQVAVPIVKATQKDFPDFSQCSFDKGYYTRSNRLELTKLLDLTVMPKKGKLSKADKELQYSVEFIEARQQHSAVESAINALENHGLDRCPDSGIDGFKSYVAMAVVGRNIQKLGRVILDRQREAEEREARRRKKQLAPAA